MQIPETAPKGFKVMLVVRAKGKTRDNGTQAEQGGAIRPVTPRDAALLTIEHGKGRVVCHFDRNTFFNKNGAGTDLHRHDNRRFAQNLFRWLAQQ